MNAAQWLIGAIMTILAAGTFCLMRYPHTRREQFQRFGACSLAASTAGAIVILSLGALMIALQGMG
jgi:hypothetical protein